MAEILRYLAMHPEAGDTPQNIAQWWISFERFLPKLSDVEEALAYLVVEGIVSKTVLLGGERFYKAVPGRIQT